MIEAEKFVRIWQTSGNVAEVAKKTNLTYGSAVVRATRYRKKGIPLKLFPGGNANVKLDKKKLAALAESLNGEKK